VAGTLAYGAAAEVLYDQLFSEDQEAADAAREIKACLATGEISQAMLACNRMLSLHPDNKLFEGLRLEIENREREVRLEFIRRLTSEVENLPDLDARVNAIQQALHRYPGESQLLELLKNATARRDLLNALIAEARNQEMSETYSGALQQWYLIRDLYPSMQGMEDEIHRVETLADSQRKIKRRAEFVEAIFRLSSTGEYVRAVYQCINALAEFPNDGGLLTLKQSIEEKAQHVTELQKYTSEGITFLQNHNIDAALECFAKARALDQGNLQVRYLIGIALLEKARVVMQNDRQKLTVLLEEARSFIGGHPELQALSFQTEGVPDEGWERTLVRVEHPSADMQPRLVQPAAAASEPPAPVQEASARDSSSSPAVQQTRKGGSLRRMALIGLVTLGALSIGWLVYAKRPAPAESSPAAPASLAGLDPQALPVEAVSEPQAAAIDVQPALLDVHIVTDMPGSDAWIDDRSPEEITANGFTIAGVEPGIRILKMRTPAGEFELSFEFSPGSIPIPATLPSRQIANVLFAGSANGKSRVECNCAPAGLRVGDLAELIRAGGLELPLAERPQPAELWLGKNRRDFTIHGGASPVSTIAVFSRIEPVRATDEPTSK
jgi:tetratricopeptide (TPR) repeat protein